MVVFQSISKTAILISLVVFGFGTSGADNRIYGRNIHSRHNRCCVNWPNLRQLPPLSFHKLELKAYFTTMLSYCLPLSFATVILTLLPQFYAFMLPIHYVTDNVPIGNYGVAMNFVVLNNVLYYANCYNNVSWLSQSGPRERQRFLRNTFRFSVKYGSLVLLPVIAIVMSII